MEVNDLTTLVGGVHASALSSLKTGLTGRELADVVGHSNEHACPLHMISAPNMNLK